ncbi:MAG: class I SAM-dependent methyltransferase [Candidatus Andersenbacteria bacterium]
MVALALAVLLVTLSSALLLTIVIAYVRTGVPTVVSAKAAQEIAATVLAQHNARVIYELGSGKGDFALRLADHLPNARVRGIELSLMPYLFSQIWRRLHRAGSRVRFFLGDFRQVSLGDADAVMLYLMLHMNRKLAPKLIREMRPGSLVISISFSIADWEPVEVRKADNWGKTRVLIYRMPPTHVPKQA